MKKKYLFGAALLLLGYGSVMAQSKIKDGSITGTSSLPGANSLLELESNKRGLLLPRLTLSTTTSASPLSAHVAGMTVYNTASAGAGATAVTPGYYYNDGSKWIKLAPKGDLSLSNTALSSSTVPAGTATGDMVYNTNAGSGVPVGPVYWDGTRWVPVNAVTSIALTSTTTPAGNTTGQMMYNTSAAGGVPVGEVFWDGSKWNPICTPASVALTSSTAPAGTSIGQMIYNTSAASGLPVGPTYWDGTNWKPIGTQPWFKKGTTSGATSNTDSVYIMGNVGIGTTSPTSPLHISEAGLSTKIGGNYVFFDRPSYNYVKATDASGILTFGTGGVNHRMVIDAAGNVGVGTTSPGNKLHVNGQVRIDTLAGGAASDSVVTADATGVLRKRSATSISAGSEPWFKTGTTTGATSNTDSVYIMGKVGIGTSAPAAQLDVNGDALVHGLTVGMGGGAVTINTAVGVNAMAANTTAIRNTAVGYQTLFTNTTGGYNTAVGYQTLYSNNGGTLNTGVGQQALVNLSTGNYNNALGSTALINITTGSNNIGIGNSALQNGTTASTNTVIGYSTGLGIVTGNQNTILGANVTGLPANLSRNIILANGQGTIGFRIDTLNNTWTGTQAGLANTTGFGNTANGYQSLFTNTTGYFNTANGYQALYSNTTGIDNTAVGLQSLYSNTTGANNTANGYAALRSNSTGDANTGNGYGALYTNTSGANNTAIGNQTLYANTTGTNNTAVGADALKANTTAGYNTANGYQSLYNNTTGINNTAVGSQSLYTSTTGINNTAMGNTNLYDVTTGQLNTSIGYNTARGITTGNQNTILGAGVTGLPANLNRNIIIANGQGTIGFRIDTLNNTWTGTQAGLANTTGADNSTNGYKALTANTTGYSNTATGSQALMANTTGFYNTANGRDALTSNTTGNSNSAYGVGAIAGITTGGSNTAVGVNAMRFNTTGNNNTINGAFALYDNTTGSNNTVIGYNTGLGITTGAKNTIIGAAVSGLPATLSNNIIIADGDGNRRINVDATGNVGIGTTAPAVPLEVVGSGGVTPIADFNIGSALGFAQIRVGGTNSVSDRILFGMGGTDVFKIVVETRTGGTNPSMYITPPGAGTGVFFIDGDSRNIGIGTAIPTSKLHVVGLPTFASDAAAGTGGLTAGAFYKTSAGVVMVKL